MPDYPRTCPVDGWSLGADPRRRWCSPRCRQAVYRAGGPAALAEMLEATAGVFASVGQRKDARELRDKAARVRAVVEEQSEPKNAEPNGSARVIRKGAS